MTRVYKTRQDKLVGVDGASLLRRAARELDALGKHNARIVEVDSHVHSYEEPITDIFYLESQLPDGSWKAETVEEVGGQGVVTVYRADRENLVPAMTMQCIELLVRGGVFNEFEPAKRHILDKCAFRCAGRVAS